MLREDLYSPWFAEDKWGFEFISGDYLGVVVQVEEVKLPEDSGGEASVDYHIIHRPEHITEEEVQNDLFRSTFELVINDILKEAIDNYENSKQQGV